MKQHRYPVRALIVDDVKAAVGLIICAGPLFLDDLSRFWLYVFSVLTALFVVFAIRTAIRHTRVIELSDKGVRTRGFMPTGFDWEDVERIQLRYYSTRRDQERGWMSLKLGAPGSTVVIDSSITGFEDIARRVAAVARSDRSTSAQPVARISKPWELRHSNETAVSTWVTSSSFAI